MYLCRCFEYIFFNGLNLVNKEEILLISLKTMVEEDAILKRRNNKNNTSKPIAKHKNQTTPVSKAAGLNLTRATSSTTHRLWTRTVVIAAVITLVYFYTKNKSNGETRFALVRESLPLRVQKFSCAPDYAAEIETYAKCVPQQCGRFVSDDLIEPQEVEMLLDLAQRIIQKSGSSGGASVLDLHSGALSHEDQFINVFHVPKLLAEISESHLAAYNFIKGKIRLAIAEQFGISASSLHLTYPTFFSRFTNATAKTVHDEYWHEHVDKETYPSFHYTSLLYLNTFGKDFKGGRFSFVSGVGQNRTISTIEPKKGRLSAFTSGAENRHHVEPVTEGERYAITISFTCDQALAIADPQIKLLPK